MRNAIERAMNFIVKKFLAKKLTIRLMYSPKLNVETAEGSVLAVFDDIMLSTAAIAAA